MECAAGAVVRSDSGAYEEGGCLILQKLYCRNLQDYCRIREKRGYGPGFSIDFARVEDARI
jgi:hypothetical protein